MKRNGKEFGLKEYREYGAYAWPGGYPTFAILTDGAVLCFKCTATEDVHEDDTLRDGWCFEGSDINWEDDNLYCAHCNAHIECAYPGECNGCDKETDFDGVHYESCPLY